MMYMLKEMPKETRPRERLFLQGASSLSNEELLAILFRTGIKDLSVIELSKKVLYHLDSLSDLSKLTKEELKQIKGIKEAKIATLLSAIELGKRLENGPLKSKIMLHSSWDVYQFLSSDMQHLEQEHAVCLYLNTKNELIKKETVFIGTINQTVIHPREIFKTAIRVMASSLIFVHNHPTGDSKPSINDIKTTEHLIKASEIIGINLTDHIIIGKKEFYSIKESKKTKCL
jgi:DNA repair protein RadC